MDNSFLYMKTLLLVDDEPDLLKMLSDILKDAGFQKILTAATGKEAVAEAKKGKPSLSGSITSKMIRSGFPFFASATASFPVAAVRIF